MDVQDGNELVLVWERSSIRRFAQNELSIVDRKETSTHPVYRVHPC